MVSTLQSAIPSFYFKLAFSQWPRKTETEYERLTPDVAYHPGLSSSTYFRKSPSEK
jgi:hypothetical protein